MERVWNRPSADTRGELSDRRYLAIMTLCLACSLVLAAAVVLLYRQVDTMSVWIYPVNLILALGYACAGVWMMSWTGNVDHPLHGELMLVVIGTIVLSVCVGLVGALLELLLPVNVVYVLLVSDAVAVLFGIVAMIRPRGLYKLAYALVTGVGVLVLLNLLTFWWAPIERPEDSRLTAIGIAAATAWVAYVFFRGFQLSRSTLTPFKAAAMWCFDLGYWPFGLWHYIENRPPGKAARRATQRAATTDDPDQD
jgi:hypothetical protein